MTKEQAIEWLKSLNYCDGEETQEVAQAIDMAIESLEQDNEEIFKQFKKKLFLESEDVLGNEMVDSYMIADYLAELLGVGND